MFDRVLLGEGGPHTTVYIGSLRSRFSFHCVEPGDQTLSSGSAASTFAAESSSWPSFIYFMHAGSTQHECHTLEACIQISSESVWSRDKYLFAVGNTLWKLEESSDFVPLVSRRMGSFFKTCPWGRYSSTSSAPPWTLSREYGIQEGWTEVDCQGLT